MALTTGRVVRQSVWYHRVMAIAVALGVTAATAVICGALLVGDSMRGSLRSLTLQRLGDIDAAIIPGSYFNAAELTKNIGDEYQVVPAIQFARAVVEHTTVSESDSGASETRRSGNVQVVASGPDFWSLDTSDVRPQQMPSGDEIVLNQALGAELSVAVGGLVTLRLPAEQAVPADSPLGRRESESEGIPRLKVVAIVPNQGLGRFSLQPSQATPLCAYVPIDLVQSVLERPQAANALLVNTDPENKSNSSAAEAVTNLTRRLTPGLSDFGLQLERVTQTFRPSGSSEPAQVVYDYYNLTSERLLISDPLANVVLEDLPEDVITPTLTYLANAIETPDGEKTVPYSTITAVDSTDELPLNYDLPEDARDEDVPVVINSWLAERLDAKIGDRVKLFYFEPETSAGKEMEQDFFAVVSDIVPVTKPSKPYLRRRPAVFDSRPTVYNDPNLTPTVPGVTDQDSINDWDLPFQLEREVTRDDDDYWAEYRLTPKAFIPLDVGQRLFGSRFGAISSIRIDTSVSETVEQLETRILASLRQQQESLGFAAIPIKAQQLAASRGTTPFDALFLSLSFFVIAAALMLVALLFRLNMEQRAVEYGTLMATGMPGPKVARIALGEGALIAIPGAALGTIAGVGYALLVLLALKSFWIGAVTVPFLTFHWSVTSLLGGFTAGILMATLAILLTTRQLRRAQICPLLSGYIPENPKPFWNRQMIRILGWGCLIVAVGLGGFAITLSGPAQAGAFVGGGMLLLIGLLLLSYNGLTAWAREEARPDLAPGFSLRTLSIRSVGRNPLRSTLSIGLMAVACFLIVSMSAFQMSPTKRGIGGFDLMGQTAVPVYKDLGDPKVRDILLGRDSEDWQAAKIFGLRFRPGQEASCNNLYQATQPQVLGVPNDFVDWFAQPMPASNPGAGTDDHGGTVNPIAFDWAAKGAIQPDAEQPQTPWQLLQQPARGTVEDPVPVILDQNTAMWSLQMRGGVGEVRGFRFDDGTERFFKVVALLGNTILQGSLIVGEQNFETMFPAINGYSYFLMQVPPEQESDEFADVLENRLGDIGMDVTDSRQVLLNLMAVQNTYLRTFQSLGALGLLLGTFGLAVVQLRNVLDRRGELALMRAIGFSKTRLAATVLAENTTLLLAGIGCGAGAALAAVIPYFITSQMEPRLLEPLLMLGLVTIVGLLAALFAVRRVLSMRLLDSL